MKHFGSPNFMTTKHIITKPNVIIVYSKWWNLVRVLSVCNYYGVIYSSSIHQVNNQMFPYTKVYRLMNRYRMALVYKKITNVNRYSDTYINTFIL
jgi:hypothetical protein